MISQTSNIRSGGGFLFFSACAPPSRPPDFCLIYSNIPDLFYPCSKPSLRLQISLCAPAPLPLMTRKYYLLIDLCAVGPRGTLGPRSPILGSSAHHVTPWSRDLLVC